ncbi:MAG: DUF6452 family protein [Paludibacteraceae bacterium]
MRWPRFIYGTIVVVLVGLSVWSCRPDTVCRQDLEAAMGMTVQWTNIDTSGVETIMNQWDSVMILGMDCDTVPYLTVKNQSKLWLPLRVDTAVTTYQILWHEQVDFIEIHHTNDRRFISNACGCMVYHTIDTVFFGGAFIDSVEILNTIVSGTTEENIRLYLNGN